MSDRCRWLYAVVRDGSAARIGATGVDGEQVREVPGGGVSALVGDVDAARFAPRALERDMEQLDWLAAVARAHDSVVREAAAHGPVVPARLATLFRDDDAVRAMLSEQHAEFAAALDALAGQAEWGVKAYVDPDAWAAAAAGPDSSDEPAAAGKGSAYLMRRRAQLTARRTAEEDAARWAEAAHARLRGVCTATRVHRPQDPRLSGREDAMALNASYLVDQEHVDELRALVAELAETSWGVDIQLTGPWPPYSFTASAGARDD